MGRPSSENSSKSAIPGWFSFARPSRAKAWTSLALAILALALGTTLYSLFAPDDFSIVAVELSGRNQPFPLPSGTATALWWDFAFIAGYASALWLGIRALIWTTLPSRRGLAYLVGGCAVVAVVADCLEDACLLLVCHGSSWPHWLRDLLAEAASAAATTKFATLLPAATGAAVGVVAIVGRLLRKDDRPSEPDTDEPDRPAEPVVAAAAGRVRSKVSAKLDKEEFDRERATKAQPTEQELDYLLPFPVEGDPPANNDPATWPTDVRSSAAATPVTAALGHPSQAAAGQSAAERPSTAQSARRPSAEPQSAAGRSREKQDAETPGVDRPANATRWRNGYLVPGLAETDRLRHEGKPVVGICLSGGGIRAACVSLGALQSLRKELMSAEFMVSVSGSGYTTGAFQQAMTAEGTQGAENRRRLGGEALHDAETVFALGGVEEDHVRRHSSYLADTAPRLILALAMIVRHLLLTLTLLFAPAVVLGIFFGWFYADIPVTDLSMLSVRAHHSSHGAAFPDLRLGAMVALGLAGLAALLLWLSGEHAAARGHGHDWQQRRRNRAGWARQAMLVTAVIGVVTLVLPTLTWASAWLLGKADGVEPVAIGGSVGSVLFTYLASLGTLLWRRKKTIGGEVTGLLGRKKTGGISSAVPNGALQLLLVMLAILVLSLGWLLLFAGMILTGGDHAALWVGLGVAVLLVILGGFVDETTLSLHPFYRARLASAFAVRAIRRDGDHQVVAAAYPGPERSTLAEYGSRPSGQFPRVIFAATANLTGEERTPPGLNAVSYTFSGDWVGGPDIGWVRTSVLQELAPARLKRDLTVQGAVAISGAAIASAMGKGGRWTQLLMTVTGARLGAWMPNPRFVIGTLTAAQTWDQQRLPRVRRLSYLLRELFDIHHHDDPLLQVTDGGHYENLGLVELLRRRPTRIFCIDSSGDSPPTSTTLAQAIILARQELGVEFSLDSPWPTEPGAGTPLEPKEPLGAFNARLSKTPIITGTFRYPPESGAAEVLGHLVVAKAMLWPELSYPVLSYAAQNPVFPHDSTGDQWFDDRQYAAYTELGRQLGTLASAAMPALLERSGGEFPAP